MNNKKIRKIYKIKNKITMTHKQNFLQNKLITHKKLQIPKLTTKS